MKWAIRVVFIVLLVAGLVGCTINPATGQRQLTLVSESQELEMGRQYDRQMVAELGLYGGQGLQEYVQQLGSRLAARSERPDLDWRFRVVDDPAVNAFALPGGYVYITRGILAYLDNEAELAAILGHEIGHVTARHSVSQMSKQQLAGVLFGVGAVAAPEIMRDYGQLAQTAGGLLFLKFSRDDERQADELGLRYLDRLGYDPRAMPEVFDMLARVGEVSGGQRLPGWQSTHPIPENREAWARQAVAELGGDFGDRPLGREEYLARLDGMVFGEDPREGYFEGSRFFHPEMKFQLRFPEGWKNRNARSAVQSLSSSGDAAMTLTLDEAGSAREALDRFFGQQGISRGGAGVAAIEGLPTASSGFRAASEQGNLEGIVAFVQYEGKNFRLLGYTPESRWSSYDGELRSALGSFGPLTDPRKLDVQPRRIHVVRVDEAISLGTFLSRYGSSVDVETVTLINDLEPGQRLTPGRSYKVVTGGPGS